MTSNLCANGWLTWEPKHTRVLDAFKVECRLCGRTVRRLVDGRVSRHVWQVKDASVAPGDRSTNSQANLAERARQRTQGGLTLGKGEE